MGSGVRILRLEAVLILYYIANDNAFCMNRLCITTKLAIFTQTKGKFNACMDIVVYVRICASFCACVRSPQWVRTLKKPFPGQISLICHGFIEDELISATASSPKFYSFPDMLSLFPGRARTRNSLVLRKPSN
jgi:hypothetical protein